MFRSRGFVLFLLFVLFFIMAVPVMAQDVPGGDIPADIDPRFVALFVAIAAVNRFVDVVKPSVRSWKISAAYQDAVLKIFAVLLGVMVTLVSNGALNLLADVPRITPLLGAILTGTLIGMGSEVVHGFIDLLYGWRARPALLAQTKYQQLKVDDGLSKLSPVVTAGSPQKEISDIQKIYDNLNRDN